MPLPAFLFFFLGGWTRGLAAASFSLGDSAASSKGSTFVEGILTKSDSTPTSSAAGFAKSSSSSLHKEIRFEEVQVYKEKENGFQSKTLTS
jgi:hypothetical protein